MASLTRGISFRRQGSSGMSWTDTWSFNEQGVLVRSTREEAGQMPYAAQRFGGSSALSRIHDLQLLDEEESDVPGVAASASMVAEKILPVAASSPVRLGRSKSVGSAPAVVNSTQAPSSSRKPGMHFIRWVKKMFLRRKK